MQLRDVFQWKTVSGEPVMVGDITITPQSQALIVRWPMGTFVWHRPTALVVEQHGQVKRYRIIDVTRIMQLGLFGAALVMSIVGSRIFVRQEEDIS
jgi:hypothetical protein